MAETETPLQPNPPPSTEQRNLPVPITSAPERESFLRRLARAMFGWKNGSTRADIAVAVEAAGSGETGVSPEERTMLRNILALRGRRIEDVMVPRADIVAAPTDIPLGELMRLFEKAGHSRLVVYADTLDDPAGMVHIRDLFAYMTAQASVDPAKNAKRRKPLPAALDLKAVDLATPLSATGLIREVLFVPPSMPAFDLFAKMQATRVHLALVVDEYGGTDGLVSLEDIVEEIVGEISDEHDDEIEPTVLKQPDGSFIADARARLDDVTAAIGPDFRVGDLAEEVDTIAGYLMARSGRLPVRGELVPGPNGFELEVLDSDPRRVKKVRIHRSKDRAIERDLEGRRRFKSAGVANASSAPASADAPASEAAPPKPQNPS